MKITRHLLWIILILVGFVVAVNLIWFVAPILGDPGVAAVVRDRADPGRFSGVESDSET